MCWLKFETINEMKSHFSPMTGKNKVKYALTISNATLNDHQSSFFLLIFIYLFFFLENM